MVVVYDCVARESLQRLTGLQASTVNIYVNESTGKIEKLQDKWNGSLPDSGIANVSLLSPVSWVNYYIGWAFWCWSFVWYTRPWLVRRHIYLAASGNGVARIIRCDLSR